ncbi:hypothetical protein SSAG_05012 [Streptomyces sp. Mg1]|nr:hypothetical protein SSAG_05012 [Streptomyces sp. Mg1]
MLTALPAGRMRSLTPHQKDLWNGRLPQIISLLEMPILGEEGNVDSNWTNLHMSAKPERT